MKDAKKDGKPILVKFKDDLSEYGITAESLGDTFLFCGLHAVLRNEGNYREWMFAGPLGRGGFPDKWLEGWWPLPQE